MAASKKPAPVAEAKEIILPRLEVPTMVVTIIGDTPLIVHAWSEKNKKEMLDKHMGKEKKVKDKKNPDADFEAALYKMEQLNPDEPVKYGFPSVAFKAAAVDACTSIGGVTLKAARQAFHVIGDASWTKMVYNGKLMRQDLVEIKGSAPEMREDMVRLSGIGRKPDMRYRPQFVDWYAHLHVRYNANVIREEQILNLFNTAGFAVGVGEWRVATKGASGMFHVAEGYELDEIQRREAAEEKQTKKAA